MESAATRIDVRWESEDFERARGELIAVLAQRTSDSVEMVTQNTTFHVRGDTIMNNKEYVAEYQRPID